MQTYEQKPKKTAAAKPAPRAAAAPEITGNINLDTPGGGRNLALPEALRARVQSQFGFTPESIRIEESPQVADMGARAMAQGDTVSFAPGAFDPYTESGQELIGHELSHIAEQARGASRANIAESNILFDAASESASDAAGRAFASGGTVTAAPQVTPVAASAAPVQGNWLKKLKNLFGGKKKIGAVESKPLKSDEMYGMVPDVRGGSNVGAALDRMKWDSELEDYIASDTPGRREYYKAKHDEEYKSDAERQEELTMQLVRNRGEQKPNPSEFLKNQRKWRFPRGY